MNTIKCFKCGKLTVDTEKSCIACGQPLNIACPECGEEWHFMYNYKFCPGCGHNMKKNDSHKPEIQYFREDELLNYPSTYQPINPSTYQQI